MKQIFDDVSFSCSKKVTKAYSTSFSIAVKMLGPSIRDAIYSIYGFVRFADEIVDTFHGYNKEQLLEEFEKDTYKSIRNQISLNPILNSFQATVIKYKIDHELIDSFLKSMKMDLDKVIYDKEKYVEYIYGSADVVGLMCLKVFVNGNPDQYKKLKPMAMKLGSAFQKVNFLRDLKNDYESLNRTYFPNLDVGNFTPQVKSIIQDEIEADFREAYTGIVQLPKEARFGVYMAYIYYKNLFNKIKRTPSQHLLETRIRIPNSQKLSILVFSYFKMKIANFKMI
ncbi:phytoene/squalene synthase family protein [Flexithrix dorotheae]|uniref:phytoene/squalene synthase family protein n=1 Tax=Flexithrix dorotheae TaxID=70993 RepID=UPI00037AC0E1|nr:phytoene/squalene synthase family protein [Flexithrix dorotheae]